MPDIRSFSQCRAYNPQLKKPIMPFKLGKTKAKKKIPVCVSTMDADLEFDIDEKSYGRDLFELVCKTIGLRETWYFGLQYRDSKEFTTWLKLDKKVQDQDPLLHWKPGRPALHFLFLAKFYPEDVTEELVQEITQHLFFLQVKQAILQQDVYCPPEASVLLASYAVQAKYGDYDESTYTPGRLANDDLLPQRVIDQYQMTLQMWEERIKIWYADHRGMTRDEAEMEYLKIAQDLDMYGVNYFKISNKKNTELWLGVTAVGLKIYEKDNKLTPMVTFPWSEIRNISFDDRKFTIKPADKSSPGFLFYSTKIRLNKLILDLCIGNHDLYMRRRKPDTIDVQQMKAQAKEEKLRRQYERQKLTREKQLRQEVERERAQLLEQLQRAQEEARLAHEALRRSEETAELLAEKSRFNEEESVLLSRKAAEAEAEVARLRLQRDKDRSVLEQKTKEAEQLAHRMVEESQTRAQEAQHLQEELSRSKLAEQEAKLRLMSILQQQNTVLQTDNNNIELMRDEDIAQLSLQIEKERTQYLEKSRNVQQHLMDLKNEIEVLKREDRITPLDLIHQQNVARGEDKYSTYKKTKSGSTRARVDFLRPYDRYG